VIELSNGCICCTVADDFLPTMRKILARDPRPSTS
jgi:cobalamin biosynthesis protein CobW